MFVPADSVLQPIVAPESLAPDHKRRCPEYLQLASLIGGRLIAFINCAGIRKPEHSPWLLFYLTQAIGDIRL